MHSSQRETSMDGNDKTCERKLHIQLLTTIYIYTKKCEWPCTFSCTTVLSTIREWSCTAMVSGFFYCPPGGNVDRSSSFLTPMCHLGNRNMVSDPFAWSSWLVCSTQMRHWQLLWVTWWTRIITPDQTGLMDIHISYMSIYFASFPSWLLR